jgi:hypothetical protein
MTAVLTMLTERATRQLDEPFPALEIATTAMEWLCSPSPAALTPDDHIALVELNFIDSDASLTPAGRFARTVTTRDDRELIVVRTQRAAQLHTLELFLGDEIALMIDDAEASSGVHAIGYVNTADLVNVITRWLRIQPYAANPDADMVAPLTDIVARVINPEGDVTLITISIDDATLFDAAFVEGVGYAHLCIDESDARDDADADGANSTSRGDPLPRLTFGSDLNFHLMLADALVHNPDDQSQSDSEHCAASSQSE